MSVEPWSPGSFEDRYREDPDPWDFATSAYERGRYREILAALGRDRYESAFEPACSIGELTVQLAERCEHLVAIDVSATAVARAAERCEAAGHVEPGHVDLRVGTVSEPPPAPLDLVVLSEVGYYFSVDELGEIVDRLFGALGPGGELVGCHWLGTSDHHRLHGSTVHQVLRAAVPAGFEHRHHLLAPGFVIDAWRAP